MAQITYEDKVALYEEASIADINKVTDNDMNEIKQVVNQNYNETKPLNEYSTSTTNSYCANYINNLQLKKLWENEDLSVDLANTNITLSSNDYDFLITFYNRNSTTTDLVYSQMSLKGSGIALTATSTASGAYAWIRARELSYVNDTTFAVSDGFFQRVNNTTVTTGLNCSPIAIYGGKF